MYQRNERTRRLNGEGRIWSVLPPGFPTTINVFLQMHSQMLLASHTISLGVFRPECKLVPCVSPRI